MEIMLSYWTLLADRIKENFYNKIVFIYDEDGSCYEDPSEYTPGVNSKTFIFNSLSECESFLDESEDIDIFGSFTWMYVNGIENKSLIYKLRG